MALATILVPLDGSAVAASALRCAARLAETAGSRLVLVRAVATRAVPEASREEGIDEAERYLRAVKAGLFRLAADRVEAVVYAGDAGPAVRAEARLRNADLIVMATRGRFGRRWALSESLAEYVLRRSGVPVLLVPAPEAPPWPAAGRHRVLVPLDGSALDRRVIPAAGELAAALGAELLLLRVLAPPGTPSDRKHGDAKRVPTATLRATMEALEVVAAPLRAQGRIVRMGAAVGAAADTIAATARGAQASAVAMATHGRGRLARLLLGSVAAETLRRANRPLLLVRATPSVSGGRTR
jgi:nucleotide-binding universal stress UspA family protein